MTRALLFTGGRIHIGDGSHAEALLARNGRVVATGSRKDLARLAGASVETIDLRGGLMLPGLTDVHVHFMWWAIQMGQVDLRSCATVEDALALIRDRADRTPEGAWIQGGRFDKNLWGRWPTAAELDRVTAGHPAALRSRDGHCRWLNTEALRLAGIDRATVSPVGGEISIDRDGVPSGILKENANALIERVIPPPTADETLAAIRSGQRVAWERGLTAVEDLEQREAHDAFRRLEAAGELGLRVDMGIARSDLDGAIFAGIRTGDGSDWLRRGHCKFFADGSLGSQTAAMEDPYLTTAERGLLTVDADELQREVTRAAVAGIAVAIHAIGDRAVRIAIEAIAPSRRTAPHLRQRIEHAQVIRREDIPRFGSMGIIASMQPLQATSDRDLVDLHWGEERAGRAYAWRSLVASGAQLAFGSDAPVEPIDPLLGIHAAVARKRARDFDRWHPEQALTLDEAIAGYTSGAAYATGRESERGTLQAGRQCDATIVDQDLARTPVDDWPAVRVTGTVTDGIVRFAAGLS